MIDGMAKGDHLRGINLIFKKTTLKRLRIYGILLDRDIDELADELLVDALDRLGIPDVVTQPGDEIPVEMTAPPDGIAHRKAKASRRAKVVSSPRRQAEDFAKKTLSMAKGMTGAAYPPVRGYLFVDDRKKGEKAHICHIVPMGHAIRNGGHIWTIAEKRKFLNDRSNVMVSGVDLSQEKGFLGPDQWLPPNKDVWPKYIERWLAVKEKYGLRISDEERAAVNRCDNLDILDQQQESPRL